VRRTLLCWLGSSKTDMGQQATVERSIAAKSFGGPLQPSNA
jgi:hypothetical protein